MTDLYPLRDHTRRERVAVHKFGFDKPELDPEPRVSWLGRHAWMTACTDSTCRFEPRPEFEQNESAYRIVSGDNGSETEAQ